MVSCGRGVACGPEDMLVFISYSVSIKGETRGTATMPTSYGRVACVTI